jgi:hypothetical protein
MKGSYNVTLVTTLGSDTSLVSSGASGVGWDFRQEADTMAIADKFRLIERDKHELKPLARSLVEEAARGFVRYFKGEEARGIPMPDIAGELWGLGRVKVATANNYAPYVDKYRSYCTKWAVEHLPVDPYCASTFLMDAASQDKTYAPTKSRLYALSWYQSINDPGGKLAPLSDNPMVASTAAGLLRKFGMRNKQVDGLEAKHVQAIVSHHVLSTEATTETLMRVACIATGFEAALRADDLQGIGYGQIAYSEGGVKLFVTMSKTDKTLSGQWAALPLSSAPGSAVQLLRKCARRLVDTWKQFPVWVREKLRALAPAEEQDFISVTDETQFLGQVSLMSEVLTVEWEGNAVQFPRLGFKGLVSSSAFAAAMKSLASEAGVPKIGTLGSHSLKVGAIATAGDVGLPDRLIQRLGRWTSARMVAHYLGEKRTLRELLKGLTEAWPREKETPEQADKGETQGDV